VLPPRAGIIAIFICLFLELKLIKILIKIFFLNYPLMYLIY